MSSNIEKMEKVLPQISIITNEARQSKQQNLVNIGIEVSCFMDFCIDELKSQADRMAGLEKAMAEIRKIEDEYYYVDAEGLKINAIDTGNEFKVEETD